MPAFSLSPADAWRRIKREWLLYHLADPQFRFLFDAAPPGEWVSLDCETTGLNVRTDEIVSIGAVRIVGDRVLTSERLELLVRPERGVSAESVRVHQLRERDLEGGLTAEAAARQLMHFIGSRPIVGYYLEFDIAMLHKTIWRIIGQGLPQPKIDVSGLYFDYKFRQLPPYRQQASPEIDLRFTTMMGDLGLPVQNAHDAISDAVMAALAFVKLRHLRGEA